MKLMALLIALWFSLGCLLTVGALGYGLVSFKRGDIKMQQYMMRARVAAQGFTILAVCGGLGYSVYKFMIEDSKK